MDSAFAWKQYYAAERARLGEPQLLALLDDAAPLPIAPGTVLVVPHTRLEVTGGQIAVAANTVIAAGADRVLALGVLHGGRRSDAPRVAAARAGDPSAIDELRGIHRLSGLAGEEFSLDGFTTMLGLAAGRAGRSIEVVERYPFLVGDDPATLPGLGELAAIVGSGALLVVTTDPIHHGHAYGSAPAECRGAEDPSTIATARALIEAQLSLLSAHRFDAFQVLAARHRSDFRDTGPVMATLLGAGFAWTMHDLALVDYSAALGAPPPSWVAGALVTVGGRFRPRPGSAHAPQ